MDSKTRRNGYQRAEVPSLLFYTLLNRVRKSGICQLSYRYCFMNRYIPFAVGTLTAEHAHLAEATRSMTRSCDSLLRCPPAFSAMAAETEPPDT